MKVDPQAWGAPVVSVIVTTVFCGLVVYSAKYSIADNQTTQTIVGSLTLAFGQVVGYYLGSSSSSRAKDTTIAKLSGPPDNKGQV